MQKFLVLGAGSAQMDLLHHLRGKFYTMSCSYDAEDRHRTISDEFHVMDIADHERILAFCRQNGVDFIYSVGSDVAMPTVAHVCEKLNLPCFISFQTARTCNQKDVLRKRLSSVYGHVRYQVLETANDALRLDYPVVLKPADSQGQRGISLVWCVEELAPAMDRALHHSRVKRAVAEEYIPGREISANVFVHNRQLKLLLLSDRISWPEYPGGLIHKHVYPASLSQHARQHVQRLVQETLNVLEIHNGPAYFQIKMAADEPRLIEVTPRLDGCHIWRLMRFATGVDLLEAAVSTLVGGDHPLVPDVPQHSGDTSLKWVLEFFCAPPATPFEARRFDIHPKHRFMTFYYQTGDRIKSVNGILEKCGYQIYTEAA